MFQTLSFCFRIGGPPPLIEEILWFGDIGLANLITQSRCETNPIQYVRTVELCSFQNVLPPGTAGVLSAHMPGRWIKDDWASKREGCVHSTR